MTSAVGIATVTESEPEPKTNEPLLVIPVAPFVPGVQLAVTRIGLDELL